MNKKLIGNSLKTFIKSNGFFAYTFQASTYISTPNITFIATPTFVFAFASFLVSWIYTNWSGYIIIIKLSQSANYFEIKFISKDLRFFYLKCPKLHKLYVD